MAQINGTNNSDVIDEHDGVTDGDDTIWGRYGDDLMFGLGGNDVFLGDPGADTIDGGSGIDTVDYYNFSTEGVSVDLSGTGSRGFATGDSYFNVENVNGTNFGDALTGDDGANRLTGFDGDDVIKGGGGADDLWGDDGSDTIKGGGGADILDGGRGTDTLLGGTEDDLYYIQPDDTVIESAGEGYDFVYILGDNYTLPDNVEGLYLYSRGAVYGTGNALGNTIYGNSLGNVLDGGAGNDYLAGGAGNDSYLVDSGGDAVAEYANEGTDTVYSSAVAYTLSANIENLSLDTATDSGVYGTGNAQANTIYGNAGSNTLNGGAGADNINGLGGNDTFTFFAGEANGDTLYEFEGNGLGAGDVIYFVGYGSIADGATFQQLNATSWEITSADGMIHDIITLAGAPTVDATDFSFF